MKTIITKTMKHTSYAKLLMMISLVLFLPGQSIFAQWVSQTSGVSKVLNDVYFTSNDIGVVVGGDLSGRAVLKTTDGGTTWNSISTTNTGGMSSFGLNAVHFTQVSTGYAVGLLGQILKTTDTASTWTNISNSSVTDDLNSVFFLDANTGYIAGNGGVILKTVNGGTTWAIATVPTTLDLRSIFFSDTDHGYSCGESGVLVITDDAGATWTQFSATSGDGVNLNGDISSMTAYSVQFEDVNTGYITASAGGLYKTTNAGVDWTLMTVPTEIDVAPCSIADFSLESFVFIANNSSTNYIVNSDNAGSSWTLSDPYTYSLNAIHFPSSNVGYIVGSGGKILKTNSTGIKGSLRSTQVMDLFPNPSNGVFTINVDDVSFLQGRVNVFNSIGQEVYKGTIDNHGKVDLSGIENGIYFLEVYKGSDIIARKPFVVN